MNALELTIEWLPVALQAWIFVLLLKKALYRRLPIFFVYTISQIATGIVRDILAGSRNYFYVYWWTAAIIAVLSFLSPSLVSTPLARDDSLDLGIRCMQGGGTSAGPLHSGWSHPRIGRDCRFLHHCRTCHAVFPDGQSRPGQVVSL